jgi:hypothetical protein
MREGQGGLAAGPGRRLVAACRAGVTDPHTVVAIPPSTGSTAPVT